MRKIMFIILTVVAMVGCEKESETNQFDCFYWVNNQGELTNTLFFTTDLKVEFATKIGTERISSWATYTFIDNVAEIKCNDTTVYSAEIKNDSLYLTGTNVNLVYGKE